MGMVTVYVYILRCADGSYYVGKYQGADLAWRVSEHNTARYPDAYTAKRRPVELVWADWFPRYDDAVAFERRLKGWSRAKKEALIRGDQAALTAYSRRGFKPSSLHPEEPCPFALRDAASPLLRVKGQGVTKDEGTRRSAFVLRDDAAPAGATSPQDEGAGCGLSSKQSLHPEERPPGPAKGRPEDKLRRVTKGVLRQAQDERGERAVLRDAGLRPAPQDEGSDSNSDQQ